MSNFSETLYKAFKHTPTASQAELFTLLGKFFEEEDDMRSIFVMKGFAGTGKTSTVSALVKTLPKVGLKFVLLAPTGRAAKVLTHYSARAASTIHRKIFKQVENAKTGEMVFVRQKNLHTDTVFIVDEASMIGDEADSLTKGLLNELILYVFDNERNKLLLIGDNAQLPPVGISYSPALDAPHLSRYTGGEVMSHELTDVTRQQQDSGILTNATQLRQVLSSTTKDFKLITRGFKDCFRLPTQKLEDGLNYAYQKFGKENVIVLTRSNKDSVGYNKFIRSQIFGRDSEIEAGDRLMVVKNNYAILDETTSEAGFIANGEFVEVLRIRKEEEAHGHRFARVELQLVDFPDEEPFECRIFLDTLYSNAASLNHEENRALYDSVIKSYPEAKNKRERAKALKNDPYFSALQVKFSYALTCHKSQGGQWNAVFVDQGYLPEGPANDDFIRWLYTASTRATSELYFLNFLPDLF